MKKRILRNRPDFSSTASSLDRLETASFAGFGNAEERSDTPNSMPGIHHRKGRKPKAIVGEEHGVILTGPVLSAEEREQRLSIRVNRLTDDVLKLYGHSEEKLKQQKLNFVAKEAKAKSLAKGIQYIARNDFHRGSCRLKNLQKHHPPVF